MDFYYSREVYNQCSIDIRETWKGILIFSSPLSSLFVCIYSIFCIQKTIKFCYSGNFLFLGNHIDMISMSAVDVAASSCSFIHEGPTAGSSACLIWQIFFYAGCTSWHTLKRICLLLGWDLLLVRWCEPLHHRATVCAIDAQRNAKRQSPGKNNHNSSLE